ncbi:MAG: hypothetical protein WCK02_03195 [Bacteroidota bacterium]
MKKQINKVEKNNSKTINQVDANSASYLVRNIDQAEYLTAERYRREMRRLLVEDIKELENRTQKNNIENKERREARMLMIEQRKMLLQ